MFTRVGYKERFLLVIMAVIALASLILGADKVATRIHCGTWPHMAEENVLFGVLKSLFTLDVRGFVGTTADGCGLPPVPLYAIPFILLVAVVIGAAFGYVRWDTYMHSPARLRRDILSRHEVIAGRAEVRREVGPKKTITRGKKARPEYAAKVGKGFRPEDGGFHLGTSHGCNVYLSLEDSALGIGPPRSGKGYTYVISDIIAAPGPVVTTSTRGDNMAATIFARSQIGPVYVFDPEVVTGRESTLKWSPIRGCEDGNIAKRRAEFLVEGTGLGAGDSGNNAEFATKATQIMQALLHAAAVGGENLTTLYEWTKDPERARNAVQILQEQSTFGWDRGLAATIELPPEQRSAEWFGVSSALGPVDVPDVRALFEAEDEEMLDIDRFLEENGTLYLISPLRPNGKSSGVGVLLVMLLDAIVEAAHVKAQRAEEGRLDPPLSLPLDEIAQIFAWSSLPRWMSAGSGEGIVAKPLFQDRSQARNGWGEQGAQEIWTNGQRKFLLGGSTNDGDLKEIASLVGNRTHRDVNSSWGEDHESHSDNKDRREGIEPAELRRLPEETSFLIAGRSRAILVDMIPWTKRPFAEDIKRSLAWHKKNRTASGEKGLWPAFPVHGLTAEATRKVQPLEGKDLQDALPKGAREEESS